MENVQKLATCLAELYDIPADTVMGFEENLVKLKANLRAWKDKFEALNVVCLVSNYNDGELALLVIKVRNNIVSYLENDDRNYSEFKFGDTNVLSQYAPEKLMITVSRDYDEGESDGIFQSWIRKAFPGSSPELSIADFYNKLLNLEECYKNAVPSIAE